MPGTKYALLVSVDDGNSWRHVGVAEADSRHSALSSFYGRDDAPAIPEVDPAWYTEGVVVLFQAVPLSSWKPLTVKPRSGVTVTEVDGTPPDDPVEAKPNPQKAETKAEGELAGAGLS